MYIARYVDKICTTDGDDSTSGTLVFKKKRIPVSKRVIVMSAGFEPARVAPLAPEASALDHSARTPQWRLLANFHL